MTDTLINFENIKSTLSSDPEFTREMRYFSGLIKIEMGNNVQSLSYNDGKLDEIKTGSCDDNECKIIIKGNSDLWLNMLAEKPKPFYQCLQSTAVKHGLFMNVANETFAYLPALNRLMQIMRQSYNGAL